MYRVLAELMFNCLQNYEKEENFMMDLDIPEKLVPVRDKIDQFVRSKIDPLTDEYYDEISVGDRWQLTGRQLEILDGLKAKAKEAGLWNFFLPDSLGGAGVSNLEYAHLAEVMARNPIASEIFNCAAPDTGNMEVIERYGSEEQKSGSLGLWRSNHKQSVRSI